MGAKGFAGAKQQGFHGRHGGVEHRGYFLVAQLLLVSQRKRYLLLAGQAGNVRPKNLYLLLPFQLGLRVLIIGRLVQYPVIEAQQACQVDEALFGAGLPLVFQGPRGS